MMNLSCAFCHNVNYIVNKCSWLSLSGKFSPSKLKSLIQENKKLILFSQLICVFETKVVQIFHKNLTINAHDLYYFDNIDDSTFYGKKRNDYTLCLNIMNQEKLRYGEIEQTIKYRYTWGEMIISKRNKNGKKQRSRTRTCGLNYKLLL